MDVPSKYTNCSIRVLYTPNGVNRLDPQKGARKLLLTSRSGKNSSTFLSDVTARRMLKYLSSLHDLHLELAACDATHESDMKSMLESISVPIGGCMLLVGLISDRSFFMHTTESFGVPFVKVDAFRALEKTLVIDDLEFFVSFSSISTVGNPGQTNYSACVQFRFTVNLKLLTSRLTTQAVPIHSSRT